MNAVSVELHLLDDQFRIILEVYEEYNQLIEQTRQKHVYFQA